MSQQTHFNYFTNYYQDAKPLCSNYDKYLELPYGEEPTNSFQNFTFSSSKLSLDPYQHGHGSLDPSRYSTDSTEPNESPVTGRVFSSEFIGFLPKGDSSQVNPGFSEMNASQQVPRSKLIAVIGDSTGITFNSLSNKLFQQNAFGEKVEDEFTSRNNIDQDDDEEEISSSQLKSLLHANIWNKEKDNMLLKLGAQFKCDWKKIAKRFHNRRLTPCFLKNRYKELIDAPFQRRVKFTHKEDLMIAKYFEKYGSCWPTLATHFKDRSPIMLKNRYYSFIRKRNLLDSLLEEVHEIENNGTLVDNMKNVERETSDYDDSQNHAYNFDNKLTKVETYVGEEGVDTYFNNNQYHAEAANGKPTNDSQQNSESTFFGSNQNTLNNGSEENKSMSELKAQVKSLQLLYLKTRAELDKVKNNKPQ